MLWYSALDFSNEYQISSRKESEMTSFFFFLYIKIYTVRKRSQEIYFSLEFVFLFVDIISLRGFSDSMYPRATRYRFLSKVQAGDTRSERQIIIEVDGFPSTQYPPCFYFVLGSYNHRQALRIIDMDLICIHRCRLYERNRLFIAECIFYEGIYLKS